VERYPHRDQRVILRYSYRVLSLLSFPPALVFSSFSLPLSCMGRECPSGCCVILRSPFIRAMSNLSPPQFYAGRRHLPTSFISHRLHTPQSLDLISCLRFPIITTPLLCVRCLSPLLSLLSYVHITFLPLTTFVVYISIRPFRFAVYFPLDRCSPIILCYPTCIPSWRH
jgi:hypothetical protein